MGEVPDHIKQIERQGGLAFPFVSHGGLHEHQEVWPGMTLRDWFAGQALAGHLASMNPGSWGTDAAGAADAAKGAYLVADAMLARRQQ